MQCLTIRQPRASAILDSAMPAELRCNVLCMATEPPPAIAGKRIVIHGSGQVATAEELKLYRELVATDAQRRGLPHHHLRNPGTGEHGAFLGTVRVAGFVRLNPLGHPVYFQRYGDDVAPASWWSDAAASAWIYRAARYTCLWVLEEPRELQAPIVYPGRMGLWLVPDHVETLINVAFIGCRRPALEVA